jgi:hypothetical protein
MTPEKKAELVAQKLTKPVKRTYFGVQLAASPSGRTVAATPYEQGVPPVVVIPPNMGSVPVTPTGSHNSHGSTGNLSPLVDRMVGSSYDVVRECVTNLEYIKHVSAHLEQVYALAKQITEGGSFIFTPEEIANPINEGDMVFEFTDNETLTIKAKGSDGIVRRGIIPLV